MRFSLCLATLVAAVAATPVELTPRQATSCTPPATTVTTIGATTYTLQGPFELKASVPSNRKLTGNLATKDGLSNVIFGNRVDPSSITFYIDQSNGHLVTINGAVVTSAYNYLYAGKTPHVALRTVAPAGSQYLDSCTIDTTTCGLDCTYGDGTAHYNCLSSPKHDPQWAIATSARGIGKACLPFTPIVVATSTAP